MNRKTILLVSSGLTLLILTAVLVTTSLKKPPTVDLQIQACQKQMMDKLKSPATAIFDNMEKWKDLIADYVKGTVDSQNSYGAMMRTKFVCLMVGWMAELHTADDWDWLYENFSIYPFDKNLTPEERWEAKMKDLRNM